MRTSRGTRPEDDTGAFARKTLLATLVRNRERAADRPAVRFATPAGWRTTTWAELADATGAVAARANTLPAAEPVVVVVDGSAASVAAVLGLAVSGVDIALVEEGNSYLADRDSPFHRLGASLVVRPAGWIPPPDGSFTTMTYDELAVAAGPVTAAASEARPDGEVLQATSGSTGEPRLARQPLRNVLRGGATYREVFALGPTDSVLVTVPLAHSFGLIGGLIAALVSGACVWTMPRFNVRRILEGLTAKATVLLATPLGYRLLAPALPVPGGALRIALSSGGPLAAELAGEAESLLGCPVRQVYGSTETGLIACHPAWATRWPADSVGTAAPGVELRARDGRLLVRTPTLFRGYAGARAEAGTEEGFYDTGDLGRIDGDGHLFLAGRKNTFINVGGRKVNPQRIARILGECPGVVDVFVYGAAGDAREQRVHAAVVVTPGTREDDVIAFCRARRLMPYEVPHRLHVLDRLPRNAMGKVDRRALLARTGDGDAGLEQSEESEEST
ncbi:class I adenylate-forming enzyme family protein [Amycolatopsis anabasis]|uniref:class I adenylate-forming enzyme family protein n=1 Tax=Amycolatopsis anabasis TaxID=1840409 RepID=UPI00131CFDA5|nr:class I adenylate-forming enzyme family protein [Amycolatopsis anabasis]